MNNLRIFVYLFLNLFLIGQSALTVPNKAFKDFPLSGQESNIDFSPDMEKIPYNINSLLFNSTVLSKTLSIGENLGALTRSADDANLYKKLSPSVVLIYGETEDGGIVSGSGSIIDSRGYILTNFHVIEDVKRIKIVMKPTNPKDKKTAVILDALVERFDEIADLAILKVKQLPKGYNSLYFGDAYSINIGMDVYAIGHPGGGEDWTFTKGIVSQIADNYKWSNGNMGDVIQTQTPISHGNSGGPLLDNSGKLIGVNSFVSTVGQNLNYAVSISEIGKFLARSGNRALPKTNPPSSSSLNTMTWTFSEGFIDRNDGAYVKRGKSSLGWTGFWNFPKDSSEYGGFYIDRNNDDAGDLLIVVERIYKGGKLEGFRYIASFWDQDFDGENDLFGHHETNKMWPNRWESYAAWKKRQNE